MKRLLLFALALAAATGPGFAQADPEVSTTPSAMFELMKPEGWFFGLHGALGRREVAPRDGGDVLDFDTTRVVALVGMRPLPFWAVALDAGVAEADHGDADGEFGFSWGARTRLNVAEYVIEHSPIVGKKRAVGVGLDASFSHSTSNHDRDFDWTEIHVAPVVSYLVSYLGAGHWYPYEPTGAILSLGVAYSRIDGRREGEANLRENRDFGFLARVEMGFVEEWAFQVEARYFGSSDYAGELSIGFRF